MATRVGGSETFMPPAGTDTRMDRQREEFLRQLRDMQLAHTGREGEAVLDHVVRVLRKNRELDAAEGTRERKNDAGQGPDRNRLSERVDRAERAPERGAERNAERRIDDVPRLIAEFQREHGLQATGRLDPNTVNALQEKGALPPASQPAAPGSIHVEQPGELAEPTRTPLRPEDKEATRRLQSMQEQAARTRVEGGPRKDGAPRTEPRNVERALDKQALDRQRDRPLERTPAAERPATDAHAADRSRDHQPVDAVPDPTRLLASLLTPGQAGKRSQTDESLKAAGEPAAPAAPPKGESADPKKTKVTNEDNKDAARDSKVDRVVDQKPTIRRALQESPTSKTAADREIKRDPLRPQAAPDKPAPSNEVAARAPLTSRSTAEDRLRLDTVMATQQAVERGVQEATGDPKATQGAGQKAGEGQGVRGEGGAQGGGTPEGVGPGAAANLEGPEGHETVQGNAKAGDDNFLDDERGNANLRGQGEEGAGEGEAFWRVPPLSEQVRSALDTITRDADSTSAVTYSWDVTFYRPGVYGPGQPAPEIWRLAVERATAFDKVWRDACDAIAIKYLYLEPDGEPPSMDDFVLALRRARVRDVPPAS